MQEKIKRSVISAAIVGLFIPTSSLLYVNRAGAAVALMFIFACASFVFIYTPIAYFATSLWIFIIIQIILLLFSFLLGVWHAYKGVSKERALRDQGPWFAAYVVMFFFVLLQLSNIPVDIFIAKNNAFGFAKNDIILVQENPEQKYLNVSDYVVFLDENYNKAFGEIIALPGDVLEHKNGRLLRNNEPHEISITLPTQPWIIPDGLMLIHYGLPNPQKNEVQEGKPRQNQVDQNKLEKNASMQNNTQVMVLPMKRIKGKALYIFFSNTFSNIGKDLTKNIMP